MAAKKSSIALMLSAGLVLVTAGGCGWSAGTGDMTAYSKEMSYRTDLNVLSDESVGFLTQLASTQTDSLYRTEYTIRISADHEPSVSRSCLTFEEVSRMAAAASVQKSVTGASPKSDYVTASASMYAQAEDSVSEEAETDMVQAEPEEMPEEQNPLESYAQNRVLTNDTLLTSTLNVRSGPGTDCEIIGRLYPGSSAVLLEEQDGWMKISSGNVEGWASSEYLIADHIAETILAGGTCRGTVTAEALNVRNNPSLEGDVVNSITAGQECTVLGFTEDGWVQVQADDAVSGYVSVEYLEISFSYRDAMTLEEEQAYLEELARQEEEARKAAEAEEARRQAELAAQRQANAVSLSEEDMRLMACVVDMEAMTEPYAGKLAVANVILNRYRSGIWGGIYSIIYAPGQFTGAGTGLLESYLAAGPTGGSMQAVRDACAGNNNIGGLMYFCSAKSANPASYSAYVWVGSQCFYQK